MFTRRRWVTPAYTGNPRVDFENQNRAINDFLLSLELKDSLAIDEAEITASNGIIFPSGTMDDFTPWTAWTPTVTAGSGSFTTVSGAGKYALIGGLRFFRVSITITTNGTAATSVRFTLPTTAGEVGVFYGREAGIAGNALQGVVAAASNTVDVYTYANAYPGGSGVGLTVAGFYV